MYISELTLQGFKSFAYKTDVNFDRGITAIVGPNGCGKSNIVDSMRWVLGEQRPTLLRSSSMSNVIFNGTAQKNALGLAEVSLTFVNNKGLLPTEYSEITITRRLYRSGESEYLINDTTCRLKDIMELFMDTGMSSDAYSVIELKMVEEILSNKNNDRRRLFEEAAGITGYKKKRTKTLRKLESTRTDLQRVEDIVSEIRKQTRSLERQSKKAQKAKEYREELFHIDQAFNSYKYRSIQQELDPLKKRIANADIEKKELLRKTNELEQADENNRKALNEKERKQSDAQRRVDQLASRLRDKQTSLQINREKINTEQNIIDQYEHDIKQSKQDLKELREVFEQSTKKLDSFNDELEKANDSLKESKEKYASIQQMFNKKNEELNKLRKSFTKQNEALNELKSRRIKTEARLDNTDEDISRITRESDELTQEIETLKRKKKTGLKELKKLREIYEKDKQTLHQTRRKREELSTKQDKLKDRQRRLQSLLYSVQSEIELLQNIASSNEAFPSSVKFLIEQHADKFRLMDVVSNIISTDKKHAVTLEAALGSALNFVVVESLEDAQKAAELLKANSKGQATFIPLDRLADSYKTEPDSLIKKVSFEKKYRALAQLLLARIVIIESIDEAAKQPKQNNITGVTLDGAVFIENCFLQSGSTHKKAGMRVGLHDKIDKLEKNASEIISKIEKVEDNLKKIDDNYKNIDLNALEVTLHESREKLRILENKVDNYESKIQIYQQNKKTLQERSASLIDALKTGKKTLEKLQPQQTKLKKSLKILNENRQEKKSFLNELEEERTIAQSRFNDARLKHQNIKNKVENIEHDIERAENGITNLKERLEKRAANKDKSIKQIEGHKKTIETVEKSITAEKKNKEQADHKLEEAKESSAAQRGTINSVEKELKEMRRQKEVNMELVHHLSMAKEKFEMQAQNISDHIWETYEILMDQIEEKLPHDTAPDEAKKRISRLRQNLNKIGEVNELAIEEYEEEKKRLNFYEEQIEDLENARNELQKTITETNKTAEQRFNKTFEKIRTNFKQVFHTLFNEDDFCELTIDRQAEDPLEASIDIEANPRGKRPAGINQLSGGEKTLTAIALLFAIYLVKPSPFCVLDEVDAPLDDANIERFAAMIQRFSRQTQFIIITHNKMTMGKAEMMYGVTMPETGISRLVGVKIDEMAEA